MKVDIRFGQSTDLSWTLSHQTIDVLQQTFFHTLHNFDANKTCLYKLRSSLWMKFEPTDLPASSIWRNAMKKFNYTVPLVSVLFPPLFLVLLFASYIFVTLPLMWHNQTSEASWLENYIAWRKISPIRTILKKGFSIWRKCMKYIVLLLSQEEVRVGEFSSKQHLPTKFQIFKANCGHAPS